MRSKVAHTIYEARRATRWTQAQLAKRIGLEARTVGRWERGQSAPKKQNHAPLVAAIRASQPAWADRLASVLRGEVNEVKPAAPDAASSARASAAVSAPAPAPVAAPDAGAVVQLAVLRLADELDLPARAVRRPLGRLFQRLTSAGLDLVGVRAQIESWIAEGG